jgi:very-short-patch-repair endonuclease
MREILPYKKYLVPIAKKLRQNMTLSEVLLWNEIKNGKLGVRFSRQIPIDNFIVDFYCKEFKLAIEVDGDSHFHDDAPIKDAARKLQLEKLGVRFIRFTYVEIKKKMDNVVSKLIFWIEENKPTPNPSQEGSKM